MRRRGPTARTYFLRAGGIGSPELGAVVTVYQYYVSSADCEENLWGEVPVLRGELLSEPQPGTSVEEYQTIRASRSRTVQGRCPRRCSFPECPSDFRSNRAVRRARSPVSRWPPRTGQPGSSADLERGLRPGR